MGFFEQPPPAEPPEEPPQPEWIGPPEGTLGGVVPVQLALAATDRVLLAVTDVAVYPNGVSLRGFLRQAEGRSMPPIHPFFEAGEDPRTMLRVGALFPDGRRAVSPGGAFPEGDPDPSAPVLVPRGGGGGTRTFVQEWWLWPAPPPGPLVLVTEWPARGVPEARATIEGDLIEEARGRILEVWPSTGPASGGRSGTFLVSLPAREEPPAP